MNPLPMAGAAGKGNAIGHFMKSTGGGQEAYPVAQKKYRPQPGDMYNMLHPNNHIGFIREVQDAGNGMYKIHTIDGNSGPLGLSV
jgi:hypothetical protein